MPLPLCFPLYTMGSKGLYIGYIYLSLQKKKSQGMEPLSLCEGHHGWLLLYAVLLHDGVHQPMSLSVCKDLAGMTTCSYPASVLERNRSSSVRIWAISNLHRISSCTAHSAQFTHFSSQTSATVGYQVDCKIKLTLCTLDNALIRVTQAVLRVLSLVPTPQQRVKTSSESWNSRVLHWR